MITAVLAVWPWLTLLLAVSLVVVIAEWNDGRVPRVLRLANAALIGATLVGFGGWFLG